MLNLESKIEALLFFKNEPTSFKELAKLLGEDSVVVKQSAQNLQTFYAKRGIVLVSDGEYISFGTHPEASGLIENIQKEELSRELGRAGLETLAIVLYKDLVSRREIDNIRGVNSVFTLRTLLVRGLIERSDSSEGGLASDRSYHYKPTLKLLEYLGITRREDLPEYETVFKKIEEFIKTPSQKQDE